MRHGKTLLAVTLLAFVGPVPMSLCAAMAGLPADCAPTPHCEEMGAEQPHVVLAAPADDCCQMSAAPVLERAQTAPTPVVSIDSVPAHEAMDVAPPALHPFPLTTVARSAPFDLQPILCVFLI